MLEDVHDSINSLVGIMQTFKAKGKMSKLFVSSLFKRRQEEAEGVINHAILSLQVGSSSRFGLPCSFKIIVGKSLRLISKLGNKSKAFNLSEETAISLSG